MKKWILALLLFFSIPAFSQKILPGRWEGMLDDELLQVNIVIGRGQLCGYTWDYVVNDPTSYCKAFFTANYDVESKMWVLVGQSFIEKSQSHELMIIKLRMVTEDGEPMLKGFVALKSQLSDIFGSRGTYVELRRMSSQPAKIYPFMQDCIDEAKKNRIKKALPPVKKPAPPKPVQPKTPPVVKKTPAPPVKKPTVPPAKKVDPPVVKVPAKTTVPKTDSVSVKPSVPPVRTNQEMVKKMKERKRAEVSRLVVNVRDITLKVYDNGVVDNDTVSIFYNGKLLVGKKWLSEKAIQIPLKLDENAVLHEITMYAENLGSIPPNTALIIVTAGDKRYELRSSATLDTNAVLVFEYKPD